MLKNILLFSVTVFIVYANFNNLKFTEKEKQLLRDNFPNGINRKCQYLANRFVFSVGIENNISSMRYKELTNECNRYNRETNNSIDG